MDREKYLKVEGDSSFVIDKESSSIVNVNKCALRSATERSTAAHSSRDEIRSQPVAIQHLNCSVTHTHLPRPTKH